MGKKDVVTVDLSVERGYLYKLPDSFGIQIGKVHGIGKRGNQEDCFGISDITEQGLYDKGILVALSDGMGGMLSGEKASTAAVISCLQYFENVPVAEGQSPRQYLEEMVLNANTDVITALGESSGAGGATFIGAYIDGCVVNWISVGDSHIYLYSGGRLIQLNKEHNYGAELDMKVAEGEISEAEARNHPQRRALTSFMGLEDLTQMDSNEMPLVMMPGDMLILMTDGIFGTLTDEEIIAKLDNPVEKIAMSVHMEVENRQKPNQDNYTGIFIRFD